MKKVSLLYFSPTDTTKMVVYTVGKTLGEIHAEYNISVPENRKGIIRKEPEVFILEN